MWQIFKRIFPAAYTGSEVTFTRKMISNEFSRSHTIITSVFVERFSNSFSSWKLCSCRISRVISSFTRGLFQSFKRSATSDTYLDTVFYCWCWILLPTLPCLNSRREWKLFRRKMPLYVDYCPNHLEFDFFKLEFGKSKLKFQTNVSFEVSSLKIRNLSFKIPNFNFRWFGHKSCPRTFCFPAIKICKDEFLLNGISLCLPLLPGKKIETFFAYQAQAIN